MARQIWKLSIGLTLAAVSAGAAREVHAQPAPDLTAISTADLQAEIRRRQLADACATFRALGVADVPAACRSQAEGAAPAAMKPEPAPAVVAASEPAPDPPASAPAPPAATAASGSVAGGEATTPAETLAGEPRAPGSNQFGLANDDNNKQSFGGIEFGIGMAFSLDLGDNVRVRDAQLVNGLVRVSRSDDVRARLILESHYFFTPPGVGLPLLGLMNPTREERDKGRQPMWGFGPFVAVQPGSDNVIDAIGAGLMLGLRRGTQGTDSFNLGIGLLYDMDVQTLGDGIFENQPLPVGETEIRFRRRSQSGLMILSSFSF